MDERLLKATGESQETMIGEKSERT